MTVQMKYKIFLAFSEYELKSFPDFISSLNSASISAIEISEKSSTSSVVRVVFKISPKKSSLRLERTPNEEYFLNCSSCVKSSIDLDITLLNSPI